MMGAMHYNIIMAMLWRILCEVSHNPFLEWFALGICVLHVIAAIIFFFKALNKSKMPNGEGEV